MARDLKSFTTADVRITSWLDVPIKNVNFGSVIGHAVKFRKSVMSGSPGVNGYCAILPQNRDRLMRFW